MSDYEFSDDEIEKASKGSKNEREENPDLKIYPVKIEVVSQYFFRICIYLRNDFTEDTLTLGY